MTTYGIWIALLPYRCMLNAFPPIIQDLWNTGPQVSTRIPLFSHLRHCFQPIPGSPHLPQLVTARSNPLFRKLAKFIDVFHGTGMPVRPTKLIPIQLQNNGSKYIRLRPIFVRHKINKFHVFVYGLINLANTRQPRAIRPPLWHIAWIRGCF